MNLPNYYTIVKHPMDLTTIRRKLLDKKYADPYEIVEDVWQMFDNAWSFNKKQSKVYRDCKKVSIRNETDDIQKWLKSFMCLSFL